MKEETENRSLEEEELQQEPVKPDHMQTARQRIKTSGQNLQLRQREENVRTTGGIGTLHATRRKAPQDSEESIKKRTAFSRKHGVEGRKLETAATIYQELSSNDDKEDVIRTGLQGAVTTKEFLCYIKSTPDKGRDNAVNKNQNIASAVSLSAKKAKDVASVSYHYAKNTDRYGRGMQGIKKALLKLEQKEAEHEQPETVQSIERRLRVSDTHAKEKAKDKQQSMPDGRLRAVNETKTSTAGAFEKCLKVQNCKYMDEEEHTALASVVLHTKKKEKKKNTAKRTRQKKAGKMVAVSNMIRRGTEIKRQIDSGESSDVSTGQGFLNLMTALGKNFTSSVLIRKLLFSFLSFLLHVIVSAIMLIITLICVIIGLIMSIVGPVLIVVICVASIFSFLFISDTEVIDTSSEKYVDNYISSLLVAYRDNLALQYVNEPSRMGGDYLDYDIRYKLRGQDDIYLSSKVTYTVDEDITSSSNVLKRSNASNTVLNDYLGKNSSFRQEFLDDIKMIYFSRMYKIDHVQMTDTEGDDQTSPYLMINTAEEMATLTQIFSEFCTITVTSDVVTWKQGKKPYPFKMTEKYADKDQKIKYTEANYVNVQVMTVEQYLKKYPLSDEEQKYYNEFVRIKNSQQQQN